MISIDRAEVARIAICGIALESHRDAPVCGEADFREKLLLRGEQMRPWLDDPRQFAFGAEMSRLRRWEPVPILMADADAGGPCEHSFFTSLLAEIRQVLDREHPVHAVFVSAHGAGLTTVSDDLDGDYLRVLRECVGPQVPIVATLDLHANVSHAMVAATNALIGLRTNPHVDMHDRAREAARLLDRLLDGAQLTMAHVRLPMVTPQVTQLTDPGQPYGDLMQHVERQVRGPVVGASALSGFAFSDTPHNGMTLLSVAQGSSAAAIESVVYLAAVAWADRHRYRRALIDLATAVRLVLAAAAPSARAPILLADVADNPGGGARGNTLWLLRALVEAGCVGVQFGLFFDPDLVRQANLAGEGVEFDAQFNAREPHPLSHPWAVRARVVALRSGVFRGRFGTIAGRPVDLGQCACLEIGGVQVAVTSVRDQLWGPDVLEHIGLDTRKARVFVAKSRGHFRAGFAHLVAHEDIHEVDVPGLTTPNLAQVEWRALPRPCWPLDADASWPGPDDTGVAQVLVRHASGAVETRAVTVPRLEGGLACATIG